MGVYDLTTAMDFIRAKTRYSKLNLVDYSLGTTIALAGLSDRPGYNSKTNKFILIAPKSRLKSSGLGTCNKHFQKFQTDKCNLKYVEINFSANLL